MVPFRKLPCGFVVPRLVETDHSGLGAVPCVLDFYVAVRAVDGNAAAGEAGGYLVHGLPPSRSISNLMNSRAFRRSSMGSGDLRPARQRYLTAAPM